MVNGRWAFTATDGVTDPEGEPVTLTWSIVPDGTPISSLGQTPSSLVSFLDSLWGFGDGGVDYEQRPWFGFVESSFTRWSEVSGVVLEYEPADDGLNGRAHGQWLGLNGVRGDLRLGGGPIDGPDGTLAEAGFIPNSDITLDVSDAGHFGNPAPGDTYRNLLNTLTHEVGHSLGLGHPISPNAEFLMESRFNGSLDGPQYDDIRGVQRLYGDTLERNGGNDTDATASDLGIVSPGVAAVFGADGDSGVALSLDQNDFLSISNASDVDYLEFTLLEPATMDLVLTPVGPTYNEFTLADGVVDIVTAAQNDLTLELYEAGPAGLSLVAASDAAGLGEAESILDISAEAGSYVARIAGAGDALQLYMLSIDTAAAAVLSAGDFNDDGVVDAADYTVWRDNFGASDDSALLFRGDGSPGIDGDDYAVWAQNLGVSYSGGAIDLIPAPEPATAVTLLFGAAAVICSRGRRTGV